MSDEATQEAERAVAAAALDVTVVEPDEHGRVTIPVGGLWSYSNGRWWLEDPTQLPDTTQGVIVDE